MKRTFGLLAASVLALSLAGPVAGAPLQNAKMSTWEIACGGEIGTFTVTAGGIPGWPTDLQRGTTPILFRAGSWTAWQDGVPEAGPVILPPPGLTAKLVGPCLLHLYGGSTATFDLVAENAYFQFP